MGLYWPNFSLVFLIHLFLYAGVHCNIYYIVSRIVTEKPHQGSLNKVLYCIVKFPYKIFAIALLDVIDLKNVSLSFCKS